MISRLMSTRSTIRPLAVARHAPLSILAAALMLAGGAVLLSPQPAIVVATTGAEPDSAGGYRAVLILDARSQLQRPHLDAGEDAVRRWFSAARLAAPRAPVVITADNALPAVQALVLSLIPISEPTRPY